VFISSAGPFLTIAPLKVKSKSSSIRASRVAEISLYRLRDAALDRTTSHDKFRRGRYRLGPTRFHRPLYNHAPLVFFAAAPADPLTPTAVAPRPLPKNHRTSSPIEDPLQAPQRRRLPAFISRGRDRGRDRARPIFAKHSCRISRLRRQRVAGSAHLSCVHEDSYIKSSTTERGIRHRRKRDGRLSFSGYRRSSIRLLSAARRPAIRFGRLARAQKVAIDRRHDVARIFLSHLTTHESPPPRTYPPDLSQTAGARHRSYIQNI